MASKGTLLRRIRTADRGIPTLPLLRSGGAVLFGGVAGATNISVGFSWAPLSASFTVLAVAFGAGALCYGLSISLYIASAHPLGATRAQGVFAAAPSIGAALSFTLLGESFGSIEAAGAVRRCRLRWPSSASPPRGGRAPKSRCSAYGPAAGSGAGGDAPPRW